MHRMIRATAVALASLTLTLVVASHAEAAGTLRLFSCAKANGSGGSASGWTGSRLNGSYGTYIVGASAGCSSGGSLAAGFFGTGGNDLVPSGSGARITWTAPSGLLITSARLSRWLQGFGDVSGRTNSANFAYSLLADSDAQETCSGSVGGCAIAGADNSRADTTNGYADSSLSFAAASQVRLEVRQGHANSSAQMGWPAPEPGVLVRGAVFTLADPNAPTVSNVVGGLASDSTLVGTETVTFLAQDAESGVYRVRVLVDGAVVREQVVDPSVLTCAAASGGSGDYDFDGGTRPCPASATPPQPIELDTTALAEGSHTIRVVVEDASGRERDVVAQRSAVVDNVGAPVSTTPPAVSGTAQVGRTLSATTGTWDGSGRAVTHAIRWLSCDAAAEGCVDTGRSGAAYDLGAGDAGRRLTAEVTATSSEGSTTRRSAATNVVLPADGADDPTPGTPSGPGGDGSQTTAGKPGADGRGGTTDATTCTGATVRFASPVSQRRSYARSATTLTGRVVSASGAPVAGAKLELTQAVSRVGRTQTTILGTTDTQPDGSFVARAPSGPSRVLQISIPACATSSGPITQQVKAELTLKTSTPKVRNRQRARFSGRVLGGYRGKGIVLELQAWNGRKWIDVHAIRTDAAGRYRTNYRFLRTYQPYTYSFRVVTRAGDAWPFRPGTSRKVRVRVG